LAGSILKIFVPKEIATYSGLIILLVWLFIGYWQFSKYIKMPQTKIAQEQKIAHKDTENREAATHYDDAFKAVTLARFNECSLNKADSLNQALTRLLNKGNTIALSDQENDSLMLLMKESAKLVKQLDTASKIVGLKLPEKDSSKQVADTTKQPGVSASAATANATATKVDTIVVPAKDEMTYTGISFKKDQPFEFEVDGQWNCGGGGCKVPSCAGDGQPRPPCAGPEVKYPGGDNIIHNLLVYVGDKLVAVEMIKIDGYTVIFKGKSPCDGRVYFRSNDGWPDDNQGQLLVLYSEKEKTNN
jgi:hypothetical protein